ncbi:UdgX family uracil-DNA binding protein [Mycolicibacterium vanbaalenii]|uniref:Type-4 uracil-DNA glycosylase n=1 Tax=Mycolicibacterium vanbaalenii (strain DSM 7251 / JCM 13017 / BCRC 16820 / KCTC 9966 / NRRL B-24157 / PYR-1) TaxID=350058 RepID=A1TA04_MYCVP|nr:UdgX family uracil-DNA binding protein [Mycolicibacterium vanbaalenii]ABM14004.1 phage SPO1 DNA polymerase-related protein [Mycolicibacterium vanbaalenii PYR-1]MCV7131050.1 UdgX family uracil-DNA binding protein [Mycolicibacterium vanbaalenii PYR-1]
MTIVGAAEFVPQTRELSTLAAAAQSCRGCDLFENASRAVFGSGPVGARMMLVGEQPGDREDVAGEPFVGPAGRLLDKALDEAGLPRAPVYLTNAVKHFKFVPAERGTRRIHKTPSRTEVVACRPWLIAEMQAVEPAVVVLLGATAAKSLLGNAFRLTAHRGEVLSLPAETKPVGGRDAKVVVTVHPSSVLRGPSQAREESFRSLVSDLRFAGELLDA